MSEPWTPGPWQESDDGLNMGIAVGPLVNHHSVARVHRNPERVGEANARLIAAAPEMAEFLHKLATTLEDPRFEPDAAVWDIVQADSRALLSRIRGDSESSRERAGKVSG